MPLDDRCTFPDEEPTSCEQVPQALWEAFRHVDDVREAATTALILAGDAAAVAAQLKGYHARSAAAMKIARVGDVSSNRALMQFAQVNDQAGRLAIKELERLVRKHQADLFLYDLQELLRLKRLTSFEFVGEIGDDVPQSAFHLDPSAVHQLAQEELKRRGFDKE